MHKLFEGMREGDLVGMVKPNLSIDEYESKISTNSLVVGFYVTDSEASKDLNRFLQKSASTILDTDISPSPDQNGCYIVFVEFPANEQFPKELLNILADLTTLTEITKWKTTLKDSEDEVVVNSEVLETIINNFTLDPEDKIEDDVMEFFQNSILRNIEVLNNEYFFRGIGKTVIREFVELGNPDYLIEKYDLANKMALAESFLNSKEFANVLGSGWEVYTFGKYSLAVRDNKGALFLN